MGGKYLMVTWCLDEDSNTRVSCLVSTFLLHTHDQSRRSDGRNGAAAGAIDGGTPQKGDILLVRLLGRVRRSFVRLAGLTRAYLSPVTGDEPSAPCRLPV